MPTTTTIQPPCDLSILQSEVNELLTNSYNVCNAQLPTLIDENSLSIIETGNWCQWQPTYSVVTPPGTLIGLDPNHPGTITITTLITDFVYDMMMDKFYAYIAQFEGSMALNYVDSVAYYDDQQAYASTMNASYAQLNQQMTALTSEVQTASVNFDRALASRIEETHAQFQDAITANTMFYQQSLASADEKRAQIGGTAWVYDPVSGKSAVSGFQSSASLGPDGVANSEFIIIADHFYVVDGASTADGITISASNKVFSIEDGSVTFHGKSSDEVAQDKADAAALAAANAANAAAAANAALLEIASDNVLASVEKSSVIAEYAVITNEQSGITTQASKYSVSSTTYTTAITALTTYLNGLTSPTAWNSVTGNTTIVGSTFRSKFQDVYIARQALLNAISDKAKTLIDTATTSAANAASLATTAQNIANGKATLTEMQTWIDNSNYVLANEVAAAVNDNTTTINGSKITTGSIYANALAANAIYGKQINIDDTSTAGNSANGGSLGFFITNAQFSALTGQNSNGGNGVTGKNTNSSGGAGVGGEGYYGGYFTGSNIGVVAHSSGQYGFWTPVDAFVGGTVYSFTGSHIAYTQDELTEGQLVYSIDAWAISMNQTLMHVAKTMTMRDKRVVGVVTRVKDTLLDNITDNPLIKPEHQPYIDYMVENNFKEVNINSLGEGGILVCSENGNIDNGDYLTSANLAGYAMKQEDDLLHSYTVAKALESVDWANETETTKLIACTYHAG